VHRFASDEHLVDRVRAGSAPAFEELFDRHHRPLLAFCRHMLGSAADAEDAVQHTFMAAYADLMRSDKPIALRPWLYSIARHRCVSMLRARRERPLAELPEPEIDHLAAAVDTREELRATLADIAHLPEEQRAALILAELGDASHAEIAQVLGCRQEKVKALIFQARSSLANCRVARDTPCAEIREQLASGGLATRRTFLRQHVRDCAGCREFGELVRLQRRRLRVLLPVAPSLGLKRAVLGTVLSSGGGGAATGVTAIVGGLAATAMVSVTVASSGGQPASAAPAAGDPARTAMTAPAPARDRPRRADAPARVRPRPTRVTQARPRRTGAPAREAGPPGKPATRTAPAAHTAPAAPAAHAAPTSPVPAPETATPPAVSGRPPGQDRRRTPPASPGRAPARPPTAKPATPPAGGKPTEPPGGGKPAEPPGGGKPAAPPGNPDPGPPEGDPGRQPHPGASDPAPERPRR
jgi:RNA polymerase sigma factor (sigma-70 family)